MPTVRNASAARMVRVSATAGRPKRQIGHVQRAGHHVHQADADQIERRPDRSHDQIAVGRGQRAPVLGERDHHVGRQRRDLEEHKQIEGVARGRNPEQPGETQEIHAIKRDKSGPPAPRARCWRARRAPRLRRWRRRSRPRTRRPNRGDTRFPRAAAQPPIGYEIGPPSSTRSKSPIAATKAPQLASAATVQAQAGLRRTTQTGAAMRGRTTRSTGRCPAITKPPPAP